MCEAGRAFIKQHKEYSLYRCEKCDVVFSDPMKNPGAEWYEKATFQALKNLKTFPKNRLQWNHRQLLDDNVVYGKRLLDIGCGSGFFLTQVTKKGYEGYGIDFDRHIITIAKEWYGLKNVSCVSIDSFCEDFSGEKFDTIAFFEVLEHQDNPNRFLDQVKNLLKPGGYIALSVPNINRDLNMVEGDCPPNHLTRWTVTALERFIENKGFEIIRCEEKKLDYEDLIVYLDKNIRFKIGSNLARYGIESHKNGYVKKAISLWETKENILRGVAMLLAPFLGPLSLKGSYLYCLGRLNNL